MMNAPEIALHVDGLIWKGWREAIVTHSIDAVFGTFELNLTRGWPDAAPGAVPPVRIGADCRLALAGETAITGYVNDVRLETDKDGFELKVSGRDRTGLLFKGAVINEPAEWKGLNALGIARAIAEPFGITVSAKAPVGPAFEKFTVQPGTTANRAIERLCRHRALFHHAGRAGELILTNAEVARDSGATLVHGPAGNVLTAAYHASLVERHSAYIVKNQMKGVKWGANTHTTIHARAVDPSVRQYSPTVIIPDEPGDTAAMRKLAVTQAALSAGRARTIDYAVAGWTRPTGGLWTINQTAPVRDVVADIAETMLISRVAFSVNQDTAPITNLTLVSPDAYRLLAEPVPAAGGWG